MRASGAERLSLVRGSADALTRVLVVRLPSEFDGVRLPSAGQVAGYVALASVISSLAFPITAWAAVCLSQDGLGTSPKVKRS
mmetsp:Transcript_37583/g.91514  ORF Transcript_37583/g.91514 Transcript_37583/m.91514 type:complete len:82 (-) Transcript_37583:100-345(-)